MKLIVFFSFLMGSLDNLTKKFVNDGKDLPILKSAEICLDQDGIFSPKRYDLLTRKGNLI